MTKITNKTKEENRLLSLDYIDDLTKLSADSKVEYPEPIIYRGHFELKSFDGSVKRYPKPYGTRGNFSFLQAPPKHKKSFLVSLMTGIYLGGSVNTAPEFRGNRNNSTVLHFDTEQGDYHALRVFKNTIKLSNGVGLEDYNTYALRKLSYKERAEFIEYCITEKYKDNLGLVVIDGIIDLISDPNNLTESEAIVQKLMTWSTVANCHILTVIHTTGNTEKPTGHLGTFLERKCEMQLHLSKNQVHKGHIDVTAKSSRGYTPEDFSFFVNEFGIPEISGFCYDDIVDYLG